MIDRACENKLYQILNPQVPLPFCPGRGRGNLPRSAERNSLAELQRKTLRPLGANTLTQFAHLAQSVQSKRLPPVRDEHAYEVRVPRSAGAEKKAAAR